MNHDRRSRSTLHERLDHLFYLLWKRNEKLDRKVGKIMSAIEDLKREIGETVVVIDEAVDEMQALIDKITSNPNDAAAVADAAAALDALQTKLKTATDAAKAATTPPA